MKFSEKVDEDGERFWKDAYENRQSDILERCVEKIAELEDRLTSQRDMISGLYEITDALTHRMKDVECRTPIIPDSGAGKTTINKSNGNGNHG